MSDMVKVKVLRMHTGDTGTHVEGDVYDTSKEHAALLADRRLVTIVGEAKAEPRAPANKAQPAPPNKSEPAAPASKGRRPKAN